MAREILFKAKRIDSGEWVYGNYAFTDTNGEQHFIFQNKAFEHEVDKDTICQYTGLTDNNGDKIWENDIVEIPTEDEYFHLKWEEDTARFVMSSNSFIVTFDNYWSHEVEVIGNIFDNPELWEGGE